ncbi:hypothetical protein J7E49_04685 [Variovorax paradoxus]|nr:hypothetical protein [Variovorax paradoxus]
MNFAELLADLNEWHFFKEFVYSKTTFHPNPQQEVELADNILWLGDLLLAFQLKEREPVEGATEASERRWFQKKVLGQATRQIRDTLRYLQEQPSIALTNHRGHELELSFDSIASFHKLVVYFPSKDLPKDCLNVKSHVSRTAGLVHIMPAHDYIGVARTLLTPAELADYLDFRAELIERWPDQTSTVTEQAILGQYLHGDSTVEPGIDHLGYLKSLEQDDDDWDMSGVIEQFADRLTANENAPTEYYNVIVELALLKRNELREFRERFQLSIEKSRDEELTRPYRITVPRTGCGFVFIPLGKDLFQYSRTALTNLTQAHKYDHRLSKCIGAAIGNHDAQGHFHVAWCCMTGPWIQDDEIERWLVENNPFRPGQVLELPRYRCAPSEE